MCLYIFIILYIHFLCFCWFMYMHTSTCIDVCIHIYILSVYVVNDSLLPQCSASFTANERWEHSAEQATVQDRFSSSIPSKRPSILCSWRFRWRRLLGNTILVFVKHLKMSKQNWHYVHLKWWNDWVISAFVLSKFIFYCYVLCLHSLLFSWDFMWCVWWKGFCQMWCAPLFKHPIQVFVD